MDFIFKKTRNHTALGVVNQKHTTSTHITVHINTTQFKIRNKNTF
jgi:hypothetical protein